MASSNRELTLLESLARTATTNTAEQVNYAHKGVIFLLSVTAEAAGETLSLKVQVKDHISDTWADFVDFGVIYTAASEAPPVVKPAVIYPGATDADFVSAVISKSAVLPRGWRAVVTHSAAGSWTYSLGAVQID